MSYVTDGMLEQGLDMTSSSQSYLTPDELVFGTFWSSYLETASTACLMISLSMSSAYGLLADK